MKEIYLVNNKGKVFVDNEDFEYLNTFRWILLKMKRSRVLYAQAYINKKMTSMHSLIMNTPKGYEVDHIDSNGLNNQKRNLRLCNHIQNNTNVSKHNGKYSSKYKGVSWNPVSNTWRARITVNKKLISIGSFMTEKEAAIAYNKASIQYHKEYANINYIE